MPALAEEAAQRVQVAPSAAFELMWILHFVQSDHTCEGALEPLEPLRERYGGRLTELRSDGPSQYSTELIVLAHRAVVLRDLDLNRFFDRFDNVASERSSALSLLSETPAERRIVSGRIDRLRADRTFRKRYLDLLMTLWSAVEPEWKA